MAPISGTMVMLPMFKRPLLAKIGLAGQERFPKKLLFGLFAALLVGERQCCKNTLAQFEGESRQLFAVNFRYFFRPDLQ